MQVIWRVTLVVVAIALLCLVGWSSRAEPSPRDTWEYKTVTEYGSAGFLPPQNMKKLNDLGSEGWELVLVQPEAVTRGDSHQVKMIYYFKRKA